ncbi:MAG: phage holin family protein [Acidimicrobiia bacterium]
MHLLLRIGLNSAAAWLTVWLVPGLSFTGEWWWWLVFGLGIGLVNTIIRPIAAFLTLPLRVLTLGLFTLVVNVGLMAAAIWIARDADIGFSSERFLATLAGALVLTIVASILNQIGPE